MYDKLNNLPQDWIIHIRSYDRHPCGDMIRNSSTIRVGSVKLINTQKKRIPNTKVHTSSVVVVRDDGTEEDERIYESEVVEITLE